MKNFLSYRNYALTCDIDDMERYCGTDWRGNAKTKEKFCYRNVRKAFQELAGDILTNCGYDKMVDRAKEIINTLIDVYNNQIKEVLTPKIEFLEKQIDLLPNPGETVKLKKYENVVRKVYLRDGCFHVNDEPIDDTDVLEHYVTESNENQYFFDGKSIINRYIKDGIIHNEHMFQKENFDYFEVIGYSGNILFINYNETNDLYVYNATDDILKKIDSKIFRKYLYGDYFIYVTWSNFNDRFSQNTIKCCKIDGSEKKKHL